MGLSFATFLDIPALKKQTLWMFGSDIKNHGGFKTVFPFFYRGAVIGNGLDVVFNNVCANVEFGAKNFRCKRSVAP